MQVKKSFLKWAGGKARLIDQLLPYLPPAQRFIEPFVGSGTVFLNTNYQEYVLGDLNQNLINVFQWIRDDLTSVVNMSYELFSCDTDTNYYVIRKKYNLEKDRNSLIQAARFIYLNRHCFNGLYRCNKNGYFNVPRGRYNTVYFPKDELIEFSNKLNLTRNFIVTSDFKQTINNATAGDVIYCDPPYLSKDGTNFANYTSDKFGDIQTKELADHLYEAVRRGASAIVSNSDNKLTREIFCFFEIYRVKALRSISANGDRKKANEIIAVLTPDMI